MYSLIGSLYINASVISCIGKYGNASCMIWILGGAGFKCMKSYNFL